MGERAFYVYGMITGGNFAFAFKNLSEENWGSAALEFLIGITIVIGILQLTRTKPVKAGD